MAKADIWMPLFIGDYLADTTRLTTEQHGAYLLLMMDYWRSGPPPDDDEVLSNITRTNIENWKKLRFALSRYFCIDDNKWRHSRIDREIEDAQAGKIKAQAKAAKAAEARWAKEGGENASCNAPSIAPSNPSSTLQEMHKECPSPSPSPSEKAINKSVVATRLSIDWLPSQADIEFCQRQRPDLSVGDVAAKFRDYWIGIPGIRGRKVDWPATWRNWVRNQRAPPGSYKTANDKAKDFADAITGRTKNEQRDFIDINTIASIELDRKII